MEYFYVASGTLNLIFILLILKKRKKVAADYLLIGVNIIVIFFLLADVLVNWKLTSETVIFQNGVPLILFPLFVFYVLQFTHTNKSISKRWYLIFMPAILFTVLSFIDHYILRNYTTEINIAAHFNAPSIWYQLIFKGSQLMFIGILIYLLKKLKKFDEEIKSGYSTIDTIDVKWLRNFTWVYLGSISITFVLFLGQNLGLIPFEIKQVFGVVYGILVFSVFYMNYQGIQHYTLAQVGGHTNAVNEIPSPEIAITDSPKNELLILTDDEKKIEQQMLSLIEEKQFYLEPKFSLKDLAGSLNKSTHQISRIINAKEGRSFYSLINNYRVKHLQQLLDDPQNSNFTILSLGLDSGFNSKASLNRIFKNITGLTPRQYLDTRSQSIG